MYAFARQAVLTILISLAMQTVNAGDRTFNAPDKRINIIVSCKSKYIDIATWSFQLQTHLNRTFNGKRFYFFIVSSLDEASERISRIAEKEKAMIGHLWFDSHGHFGRRISLIEVGNTEVNFKTIHLPNVEEALSNIARYCDKNTIVGLGSCYSGATFTVPAIDKFPEQRMNGDSLMIKMSRIMNGALVLGTKSWVMTKPGIFNKDYAMHGKPLRRRFMDPDLLPAWKDMGEWVAYSSVDGIFYKVRSVSLNNDGFIQSNYQNYLAIEKHKKQQMKYIGRLKKGNFKVKYFYQYEFPLNSRENQTVKRTTLQPGEERSSVDGSRE